mgnify:CR=1 FL=1
MPRKATKKRTSKRANSQDYDTEKLILVGFVLAVAGYGSYVLAVNMY